MPNAMINTDKVHCTWGEVSDRARCISGRAGRYMSVLSGCKPVNRPTAITATQAGTAGDAVASDAVGSEPTLRSEALIRTQETPLAQGQLAQGHAAHAHALEAHHL